MWIVVIGVILVIVLRGWTERFTEEEVRAKCKSDSRSFGVLFPELDDDEQMKRVCSNARKTDCKPCKNKSSKVVEKYPCAYGPATCCKKAKDGSTNIDDCWVAKAFRPAVADADKDVDPVGQLQTNTGKECKYYTRVEVSSGKWVCPTKAKVDTGYDWDNPGFNPRFQCTTSKGCVQRLRNKTFDGVCAANATRTCDRGELRDDECYTKSQSREGNVVWTAVGPAKCQ